MGFVARVDQRLGDFQGAALYAAAVQIRDKLHNFYGWHR